jgi:hypothetical protein
MWFWHVNETIERVLCSLFFLILPTLTCLRLPPGIRVPQVEYHYFIWRKDFKKSEICSVGEYEVRKV